MYESRHEGLALDDSSTLHITWRTSFSEVFCKALVPGQPFWEAAMGPGPHGWEESGGERTVRSPLGSSLQLGGCSKFSPRSWCVLVTCLGVTELQSRGECPPGGLVSPVALAPLPKAQSAPLLSDVF